MINATDTGCKQAEGNRNLLLSETWRKLKTAGMEKTRRRGAKATKGHPRIQEPSDWSSGCRRPRKQAQEAAPPNYLFEQSRQQVINSANKANEPENETETLSNNATKAIMNLF